LSLALVALDATQVAFSSAAALALMMMVAWPSRWWRSSPGGRSLGARDPTSGLGPWRDAAPPWTGDCDSRRPGIVADWSVGHRRTGIRRRARIRLLLL